MSIKKPNVVLHICQRDHPAEGGAYRVGQALVKEQCKKGVDSRLLFLYGQPGGSMAAGFNCHYFGAEQGKVGIREILRLAFYIKRSKPDVIHCHDGILWPRIALWPFRAKAVHHCHLDAGSQNGIKNRLHRWMTMRANSRFIAISEQVMESWISAGIMPEHISLIPNGVDFERFVPTAPEKAKSLARLLFPKKPEGNRLLLWLGRVDESMKGTDRLKHLVPNLPPGISLAIVGDGPERAILLQRFEEEIRKGVVTLPGAVEDPLPWYQAADAFLFTSHYEPFGLVLLEAASCGLPIIAFPVNQGGAIDLLKDLNANCLPSDDIERAINQIQFVLMRLQNPSNKVVGKIHQKYSWSARESLVTSAYDL